MREKAKNLLLKSDYIFPMRFGVMNLILSFLMLYYFYLYNRKAAVASDPFSVETILIVIFSIVSINILWQFISTVTSWSKIIRFLSAAVLVTLYIIFASYHNKSRISFDYSIMADNSSITFTKESLSVILESVGVEALIFSGIFIILALAIGFLRKAIPGPAQNPSTIVKTVSAGFLYFIILSSSTPSSDELTFFFQSMYHYYTNDDFYKTEYEKGSYPFIINGAANASFEDGKEKNRPNIFIIMVESFNANFVNSRSPEGDEYTPYFNSRIKDGIFVQNFYGNSMQSCKGQFATLFSMLPSMKRKVFTSYADVKFKSLPELLSENSYETMFFKAYRDINFDNTGNFVRKNGIKTAMSIVDLLKDEDKKHIWGWGVEDQIFYKRFFEFVDGKKSVKNGKTPVFAVLHTVMNHMKFNKVPKELRHLYRDPSDMKEHYANSIHLTDKQLEIFMDEMKKRDYLRNSIVIITGDHSFPIGEHGYFHNENSYYEEFFKTPFLMLWEGKLTPETVTKTSFSQIDIAPTLADMANIPLKKHHFQGRSMLTGTRENLPIHLIQPYNGKYLAVVEHPYKYIRHIRSGDEIVYNLEKDPGETVNIINEIPKKKRELLRNSLEAMYLNQQLLDNNEIWKDEK